MNCFYFFVLQDDKDLVPEFVNSDGLSCFIKVGGEADHNYQNYILRGGRSKINKYINKNKHKSLKTFATESKKNPEYFELKIPAYPNVQF